MAASTRVDRSRGSRIAAPPGTSAIEARNSSDVWIDPVWMSSTTRTIGRLLLPRRQKLAKHAERPAVGRLGTRW